MDPPHAQLKAGAALAGDRAGHCGVFTDCGGVSRWKIGAAGMGGIRRELGPGPAWEDPIRGSDGVCPEELLTWPYAKP